MHHTIENCITMQWDDARAFLCFIEKNRYVVHVREVFTHIIIFLGFIEIIVNRISNSERVRIKSIQIKIIHYSKVKKDNIIQIHLYVCIVYNVHACVGSEISSVECIFNYTRPPVK